MCCLPQLVMQLVPFHNALYCLLVECLDMIVNKGVAFLGTLQLSSSELQLCLEEGHVISCLFQIESESLQLGGIGFVLVYFILQILDLL